MMPETKGYVDARYLRASTTLLNPLKHCSYTLMHVHAGQKVLDLGCGPGIDTIALARFVGEKGYVVGIDRDAEMLAIADERARKANVVDHVDHRIGDAVSIEYDSEHFDACRSERLFMHLFRPEKALSEMVRVTRAGGWIVVADPDWGSLSIDCTEIDVGRRLATFRAERALNNGYSGRRLYRLFREQRLSEITVEIFPIQVTDLKLLRYMVRQDEVEKKALAEGIVSQQDLHRWRIDLEQANSKKSFFTSINMIMVAGRRP
jgi:SAM-dependent methyltransferase